VNTAFPFRWLKVSILEKQRKEGIRFKRKSQSSEMAFSLSGTKDDESFLYFIMVPYAGSSKVENMQVKEHGR
jgi:hypothetical protein